MLHEVLLALSGHPSPLFSSSEDETANTVNTDFPLLSSSEAALLESVGRLALLHRKVRDHAESIASDHTSTICRAVALSLLNTHLARFQDKIVDVERHVLNKDTETVGAYNIVPLSSIVTEFDEWNRRMAWYWQLACFIQWPKRYRSSNVNSGSKKSDATGASVIDHLRAESRTGYPDIEDEAVQLSKVAETAWLRQLSVWLLHGNLSGTGAKDFFVRIQEPTNAEGQQSYSIDRSLLPGLVTQQTASSLLFIGKSIRQIKQHGQDNSLRGSSKASCDLNLASSHLAMLSSLSLPLVSTSFTRTVASIRSSLSHNVLQHLLPMDEIARILAVLRQFFLLGRGEFALALLAEAESILTARQDGLGHLFQNVGVKDVRSMALKDGEVTEALTRALKTLVSSSYESMDDHVLEYARDCIRLEIGTASRPVPSMSESTREVVSRTSTVSFSDVVFPVSTTLTLDIHSPLDLFVSSADVAAYSSINAYLLAIRRAHVRLSDLWKLSSSRREMTAIARTSPVIRSRTRQREMTQRKVWATCGSCIFLLSETAAYLEGEIIESSWDHFYNWVVKGNTEDVPAKKLSDLHLEDASHAMPPSGSPHDPETLASGHRAFLDALFHALMLTDVPYTTELRRFLTDVDQLIASFTRLQHIQRNLELEQDEGVIGVFNNYVEEEQEVSLNLDRARKRVDSGLKSVVARLRQLDHDRIGSSRYVPLSTAADGGFVSWKAGGIDRLLMKLDFGRLSMVDESIGTR